MTNAIVILSLVLTAYLAAGQFWWQKVIIDTAKKAVLDNDDFDATVFVAYTLEKTAVHFIVYGSFLLFWPGFLLVGFILSRFPKSEPGCTPTRPTFR